MAKPAPQSSLMERLSELIHDMTKDANVLRDKRAATDALIHPLQEQIDRFNQQFEVDTKDVREHLTTTRETFFQLLISSRGQLFRSKKSFQLGDAIIKQIPSTVLDITDEKRVIKRLKAIGRGDLIKVVENVLKDTVKRDTTVFQRVRSGWKLRKKLIFNVDLAGEPRPQSVKPDDPFHPSESIYLDETK